MITGSSSSDLIEILSGASASLSCGGNPLNTHSWPSSGGSATITIEGGAGDDIIQARTAEFSYAITNAVVLSGGTGDDCLSTDPGSGGQQHDYDILRGGGGSDVVIDNYGTHDKLFGDDCTDVYPYICASGGGDDCVWAPTNYDFLICGPGTDESYPDLGVVCENIAESCACGFSWSPPW